MNSIQLDKPKTMFKYEATGVIQNFRTHFDLDISQEQIVQFIKTELAKRRVALSATLTEDIYLNICEFLQCREIISFTGNLT